jgi:hypothetical protein
MSDSFDKAIEYAAELDEVVAPGALDSQIGLIVPLTVYTGGERTVVGSASIDGDKIIMHIDGVANSDIDKMIRGENRQYTAASFSFGANPEITMIKGNYPGATEKRV